MVLFLFNNVIYVFLLLWLYILIVCLCMATLTEVFPCFFLSCKADAGVKPAETGHVPHSSKFLCCSMYFCVVLCIFVLLCILFVFCRSLYCLCLCVLYYCHRVGTQLQLTYIIYYLLLHILKRFWWKLSEDTDSAEICWSRIIERKRKL
jgi:hypothetical protein